MTDLLRKLCCMSYRMHQVEEAIGGILSTVDPVPASSATVAISGTYNVTLVSIPLQVNSTVSAVTVSILEEQLAGSVTLGGLEAMLSTTRSIAILNSGQYASVM